MVLCDFIGVDTMLLNNSNANLPPGNHTRDTMIKLCQDRFKVMRKLINTIHPPEMDASDSSSCSSQGDSDGRHKIKITWKAWQLTLTVSSRELINFCAIRGGDAVWARPQDNTYILASSSRKALEEFATDNFDVLMYYYCHRFFKDIEPWNGPNPVLL